MRPGPGHPELLALAEQVLAGGETVRSRLVRGRYPDENGQEVSLSLSLFRLSDHNGRVLGLALLAEDVTVRETALGRLRILDRAHQVIGNTLDVTATAQELVEVAVPAFADGIVVDVLEDAVQGRRLQPGQVGPDAVLRRAARRNVDAGPPLIDPGELLALPPHTPYSQSLADLRPRLIADVTGDEPWFAGDPVRARRLSALGVHSLLVLPLTVHNTALGLAVLYRHRRRDPFGPDDLRLAEKLASRTAMSLDRAHAYVRERTIATALQRHLLPAGPPDTSAAETAHLLLPGDHGADWFDVIPLSGARIALTVGTVSGRGIEAAAAMGQLRTAVQTLAAQDLAPDELLTRLDEAAARLAADAAPGPAGREFGQPAASCLYLVYDPVSRRCTAASAGHHPPLVLAPDGSDVALPLRAGPPLGAGGGRGSATAELAEGSLIALYSRGLVDRRDRPSEDGRRALRRILGTPDHDLAQLCDDAAYGLPPDPSADDASLLLARTRVLGEDRVAHWTLPLDPSVVVTARRLAGHQLAAWHLDGLTDSTTLVVSELVTNAIRYGSPPLTLRLLRDRELICEVSDGSSTTPHLRIADETDEGGRGLFLVGQLSRRWGTRFAERGKTIWSAQAYPADDRAG